MSRALAYYHATLRAEGVWTVRRGEEKPVGTILPQGFFDCGEDDDEL